jgi:hypothetical protein
MECHIYRVNKVNLLNKLFSFCQLIKTDLIKNNFLNFCFNSYKNHLLSAF